MVLRVFYPIDKVQASSSSSLPSSPSTAGWSSSASPQTAHASLARNFFTLKWTGGEEERRRAEWLPETYGAPCPSYAEGYGITMYNLMPWMPPEICKTIGKIGLGLLFSGVRIPTFADEPPTAALETFVPIIYSHGLGGNRSCYSSVCIDLASHGYVVFALEHSDGSASLNVLPDKTVTEYKHAPRKAFLPSPNRIKKGFTASLVPEEQRQPVSQYEFRHQQLEQRVEEVRFIADVIQAISEGKFEGEEWMSNVIKNGNVFANKIDMSRLGGMGHSFGACTILKTSFVDSRFKACVLHDSWLFPLDEKTAHSALTCPTLFLNSSTFDNIWPTEGAKVQKSFVEAAKESGGEVYVMHLIGTKHASFADFPVLFSDFFLNLGVIGPTDPKKAMRAVHACDVSFFNSYLHVEDSDRLEKTNESLWASLFVGISKEGENTDTSQWRPPPDFEDLVVPDFTVINTERGKIKIGCFTNDPRSLHMEKLSLSETS